MIQLGQNFAQLKVYVYLDLVLIKHGSTIFVDVGAWSS